MRTTTFDEHFVLIVNIFFTLMCLASKHTVIPTPGSRFGGCNCPIRSPKMKEELPIKALREILEEN